MVQEFLRAAAVMGYLGMENIDKSRYTVVLLSGKHVRMQ